MARSSSAASSGCASLYAASCSRHLPCAVAPRLTASPSVRPHRVGDVELRGRIPAERGLGRRDLGVAERRAMRRRGAGLLRRAVADGRADHDHRGLRGLGLRRLDRGVERGEIGVAVLDVQHVPAARRVARADVLGHDQGQRSVERDLVRVVEVDQLAEPEVARDARGLGGDALHHVAVGDERVRRVIDDLVAGAVEVPGEVLLGDRHADRVRGALAERPGRRLDAGRRVRRSRVCPALPLRVAGGLAAPLAEVLAARRATARSR